MSLTNRDTLEEVGLLRNFFLQGRPSGLGWFGGVPVEENFSGDPLVTPFAGEGWAWKTTARSWRISSSRSRRNPSARLEDL